MRESSSCFRRSCGTVPGLPHQMAGADTPCIGDPLWAYLQVCQSSTATCSVMDTRHRPFDSHLPQPYNLGMDDVQTDAARSSPRHLPAPGGCSKCTGRWSSVGRWTSVYGCSTDRARRPLSHRHKDMRRRRSGASTLSALGRTTSTSTTATWLSWSHLGLTPREIMLGFTAKAGEPLAGARQFPTHGASPRHRMINLSNVVGTQIPQAVGSALASKMRGEDTVTIVYFGDGASSVGDCHEAMNYAAVHKLPVIFLCENNGYAISVPLAQQMAVDSVAGRAEGYGMPGVVVDGTDIMAVYEATSEAAERARSGGGPTIIETMVERYLPHTSDDDDSRYRLREDIDKARERDPVRMLREQLLADGFLSEEDDVKIRDDAKREVNEATDFIDAAPYPTTEEFFEHVYADGARPGAPL